MTPLSSVWQPNLSNWTWPKSGTSVPGFLKPNRTKAQQAHVYINWLRTWEIIQIPDKGKRELLLLLKVLWLITDIFLFTIILSLTLTPLRSLVLQACIIVLYQQPTAHSWSLIGTI
jgi:hypothetical protein